MAQVERGDLIHHKEYRMSAHDHHESDKSRIMTPSSISTAPRSRRDAIKAVGAVAAVPMLSAFLPMQPKSVAVPSWNLIPGSANMALEPVTQTFIDSLAGAAPLWQLAPTAAHQVLTDIQTAPIAMRPADIVDTTFPVGPTGTTRIRILRPKGVKGRLPVLMYFHGGGWVLGDKVSHERLVRELAEGTRAAVVFVDYINSPDAKYPTQNEQAYASMQYVVDRAEELNVDASRLAIMGDSVGGNMTAAVTLMAKERNGPKIAYQVLFYPLTDYIRDDASYQMFADGPWLIKKTMQWMFDLQGLDGTQGITAYPLRATIEQLRGLPDALVVTDDDILQVQGEAYAGKLAEAGVRVTAVRFNGTIHDFALLNPIAGTPATRGAIELAISKLRTALGS
jgi:acetyl esterase